MAKLTETNTNDDYADLVVKPTPPAEEAKMAKRSKIPIPRSLKLALVPFKRTAPCSTFKLFPLLPTEIRLQIWAHSITPRVHELHPCAKLYNDRMTFRSNSSHTPSIFHTTSESRGIALKHHKIMEHRPSPPAPGKGILRFYFSPEHDTLLLNSLMGLFVMFMLLEDEHEYGGFGRMEHWRRVAVDAERAQLISLLAGLPGQPPQPRFKAVFPALEELIIAFDYTSKGKTRFRTSVWPGENGTTLLRLLSPPQVDENGDDGGAQELFQTLFRPMRNYLENDFKENGGGVVPEMSISKVRRKRFLRGDLRYAVRKTCTFFGVKPRGPLRRL